MSHFRIASKRKRDRMLVFIMQLFHLLFNTKMALEKLALEKRSFKMAIQNGSKRMTLKILVQKSPPP